VDLGDFDSMNLTRKLGRIVNLRVQQHLAGQKQSTSYRLGRLVSIESLAAPYSDSKHYGEVEKLTEPSC